MSIWTGNKTAKFHQKSLVVA